jgi:hypothetical protein
MDTSKNVKVKTVMRMLPCDLTEDEQIDFGRQLAETLRNKYRIEAEKKRVMADYADSLKNIDCEIASIGAIVGTQVQVRNVRCQEFFDFNTGTVHLVRLDNDQAVGEPRKMREDEKEQYLFETQDEIPMPDEEPGISSASLRIDQAEIDAIEQAEQMAIEALEADAKAEAQAGEPGPDESGDFDDFNEIDEQG